MFLFTLVTDLVSFCVGWFSTWRYPRWLIKGTIEWYVERYQLKMDEASQPVEYYQTLGQLFTRELKAEARPIERGACSPVDGLLRECGPISQGMVFEVKNQITDLSELLKSEDKAKRFENGTYWNFYLSPQDCHHVFCPLDGEVSEVVRIPGALFPVNDLAIKWVSKLFIRNARMVTYIETSRGLAAVVMVGALNVGKMESCFEPTGQGDLKGTQVKVKSGERLGTFHLGSSVVLLTEWSCTPLDQTPKRVSYGEHLAGLIKHTGTW